MRRGACITSGKNVLLHPVGGYRRHVVLGVARIHRRKAWLLVVWRVVSLGCRVVLRSGNHLRLDHSSGVVVVIDELVLLGINEGRHPRVIHCHDWVAGGNDGVREGCSRHAGHRRGRSSQRSEVRGIDGEGSRISRDVFIEEALLGTIVDWVAGLEGCSRGCGESECLVLEVQADEFRFIKTLKEDLQEVGYPQRMEV